MIDGPIYTGGSKYFNESTGKYEFANEQEYQDFVSDPGKKSKTLPEGSYVIGAQPVYKEGDPNTITYNYTGGFSGLEGGEPTTVPLGLYDSPAPGRTQGIYNMMMPRPGYKFGYDDQGFRYTVPEDYDFAASIGPQPSVGTPSWVTQATGGDIGGSTPFTNTQQPLTLDFYQRDQSMYNDVYNMSADQRMQWAQGRQMQRDVKSPKEQELINAVLGGTYDAMQFRPTDDAGNPLGSQMYGVKFALPSNYVPTGNEATAMATTNTDVSNLPAYTPPQVEGQQQIVSTQPQNLDEINVVDYQGLQAMQPVMQPSTQLAPQVQQIQTKPGEFQTAPTLGQAPTVGPITAGGVAVTGQPEMAPTALADMQTTSVIDRPDVTATSAVQSIQAVSEAADALKAAQIELEDVDPRATVQGQLAMLQKQFEGGQVPVWAQGPMREVTALMAQRGMGSSSIAAESITNALMQSTIPIAQQDASFYQTVTMQNLANDQQAEMAKFNSRITSIFNDQAAENTARNINAASENEMAQFYTNLAQSVALANTDAFNALEQFNATTTNQAEQFAAELGVAVDQFNADAINDRAEFDAELVTQISQFNASMKNNREQFDVQNQIAIDASNIQWRRDVNTANTSATNAAIQFDIQNMLDMQNTALNNIWNHYDTLLNMTWKSEENAIDRTTQIAIATMQEEMRKAIAEADADGGLLAGIFSAGAKIIGSDTGKSILTKMKII